MNHPVMQVSNHFAAWRYDIMRRIKQALGLGSKCATATVAQAQLTGTSVCVLNPHNNLSEDFVRDFHAKCDQQA